MAYEIIYVCNSINNKNVREGELKILQKHEAQLYFEFGENDMNIKKRYYKDLETLNKDFDALLKLKEKNEKNLEEEHTEQIAEKIEEKITEEENKKFERPLEEDDGILKLNNKKKYNKKNNFLF